MPNAEFRKTLFDAELLALTNEVVRLVGVFAAAILKLHDSRSVQYQEP